MITHNPNAMTLIGQIESFKSSIQEIKTTRLLEAHYNALIKITRTAIQQLQSQIKVAIQNNWRNYLESWIAVFITLPYSDPKLVALKNSLEHHENLLDDLLNGSVSRIYHQSLHRMQYTLSLAQTDSTAFIKYILAKNIKELNDQEITIFVSHSTSILRGNPNASEKEFISLRCSIYLWLSNLARANSEYIEAKPRDRDDLSWWLSTIGKCYLFTSHNLGSCAYDFEELPALNQLVYNWLCSQHECFGSKKHIGNSFTGLIEARNQFEFEKGKMHKIIKANKQGFFPPTPITIEKTEPSHSRSFAH